jgi:hypothetical protein
MSSQLRTYALSGSGDIVVLRVVGTDGWAWFGTAVTEELDATLEACAIPKREGSAWDLGAEVSTLYRPKVSYWEKYSRIG